MDVLDLFFPKKCVSCHRFGNYLCNNCRENLKQAAPVCPVCGRQAVAGVTHPGCKRRLTLDGLVAPFKYEGPVKQMITKIKYKFAYDISKRLVEIVCEELWRFRLPQEFKLVPIPLHAARRRWRGFNQAELIIKNINNEYKVEYSDLLVRVRNTKSQVGLKKDQRAGNIKGAFAVKAGFGVKGKSLIIVDDVFTSGSTMNEACRVLKKAGAASVWGMAAAYD
ncbi:ComF family protein [Candidatus Curtissbacteria bacterium]|nr:ComF family protein [Candidatus Curtissbacteria bacterium]